MIYPAGEPPITLILVPGFRESRDVRYSNVRELSNAIANPEVLAGTLEDLLYVADRGLARVSRGVVVMAWERSEPLSDADREHLWVRFGVPVFLQYFNAENDLLATECDAHSGLHLVRDAGTPKGYVMAAESCPCGDKRPLVVWGGGAVLTAQVTRAANA